MNWSECKYTTNIKQYGKYATIKRRNFADRNIKYHLKRIVMDFYEVLEKRRTIRDFSDREVTDEMLEKILSWQLSRLRPTTICASSSSSWCAAAKNIAKVIAPLAKNMEKFKKLVSEVDESGDKDKWRCSPTHCPNSKRCSWRADCSSSRSFAN